MDREKARAARCDLGTIHQLVEAWAADTPGATAIVAGDTRLSFRQLNEQANALARRLRAQGVGPETRLAVAMPRVAGIAVALLGVLKAGGAYVPIDPDYPEERRAFILADAAVSAVVTTDALADDYRQAGRPVFVVPSTRGGAEPDGPPGPGNLDVPVTGGNMAYLIYTSGSTGQPKGVVVDHHAVVSLLMDDPRLAVRAGDRVAQFAPTAFDASTFEIWAPLCRGGQLIHLGEGQVSIERLGRDLRHWRPDWLFLTTGLFHLLADLDLDALRSVGCLLTGGDVLSPRHIRAAASLPEPDVYAAYGPTEATTFASLHHADETSDYHRVPIGTALRGSRLYVLDDHLAPAADGVVGDLYIGGHGLARGYHARPGLTADRFLPDPFAGSAGGRMYRTGDRALRLPNGDHEFHGRADRQVKVRGFRIELGEVEAALNAYQDCTSAVVTAVAAEPSGDQDKRLAAYLVAARDREISISDLRAWLSRRLPAHAIPATFIVLDRLPVDVNGKLDRSCLPIPWKSRAQLPGLPSFVPAESELESVIAASWAEVLDLDTVGTDDNFFELGGDSLRSVSLLEKLRSHGIEFTASEFFSHPTVGELAGLTGGPRGPGMLLAPNRYSEA